MKTSCLLTLLFTLLCTCVRAQCPTGSVVIQSDAELAGFLTNWPNCTELAGDLNLELNVTKLTGLENLTTVGGNLTIRSAPINDLDGLVGLRSVGGDFGLTDLDFNGDLGTVPLRLANVGGELNISDNPGLEAIDALEDLTSADALVIRDNDNLSSIDGLNNTAITTKLEIIDNADLSDCAGAGICSAITTPLPEITISGNSGSCANYFALEAECLGTPDCPPNVTLRSGQDISEFTSAYPNCVNLAGDLRVSETATQLNSLDLVTVGGDVFISVPTLTNLDGFGLVSVGGNLDFQSMPQLISSMANGPLPLETVGGRIRLTGMQNVTNVAALQNLTSMGGLTISFMFAINDLSDWAGVSFTGSQIVIASNNNLQSLDLLSPLALDGVEVGSVTITNNPLLDDISDLDRLESITSLAIQNNPNLETCSIDPVCGLIGMGTGSVAISNNAVGCNTIVEVKTECFPELQTLINFYNATNGPGWTNAAGWAEAAAGTSCTPCDGSWAGITCNAGGRVTRLILDFNNLTGTVNTGTVGGLPQLELLALRGNNLTGAIPADLFELNNISSVDLATNDFTGGIPPNIGNAGTLTSLKLSSNENLGGVIPSSITNLTNLAFLELFSCGLTGTLPNADIGNMTSLKILAVNNNSLDGNLSGNIGLCTSLEGLNLQNNQLSGLLPGIWNLLPNLKTVDLSNNNFNGAIPVSMGNAIPLESLSLANNTLSGDINSNFRNLINMEQIYLQGNGFTGPLPKLDQSPNLFNYFMGNNDFAGSVPDDLLNTLILEDFSVEDNELTGALPLFLANQPNLQIMDLGNNNFSGCYPPEYSAICGVPMFLTLSGNENLPEEGELSGFTVNFCQNGDACGSLPVSWLSFTATPKTKSVVLSWATEAEENNAGFRVERSTNGQHWLELGSVSAGGNQYNFIDNSPFSGDNFYRIRQIDFDGAFGLSPVAHVSFSGTGTWAYPNPFNDRISISSMTPDTVDVYDLNGRKVREYAHLGGGAQVQSIVLKSGVYTLRLRKAGRVMRIVAQ